MEINKINVIRSQNNSAYTPLHYFSNSITPCTPLSSSYLVRNTNYQATHYAIFSILLLLSSSEVHILSSALNIAHACYHLVHKTKLHDKPHRTVTGIPEERSTGRTNISGAIFKLQILTVEFVDDLHGDLR